MTPKQTVHRYKKTEVDIWYSAVKALFTTVQATYCCCFQAQGFSVVTQIKP